ncbi:hypothetical protein ML462_13965 [Gramella lutea]|uniref:Uncharacterized protein n=1 Tax=Christiangramia lutea TaxID=1607951 RepID=A0A9X2ACA4_9FLAO|nr:hypothetical protein [Christiangramia lutea]MCH4824277.1 hypothetical protein [Christiangramia lutea]
MDEQFTTYTVTGKNSPIVWQFKYHLNGLLAEFKLLEGELDAKQINWLFVKGKFPYREDQIKQWNTIPEFDIKIGEPDLSFDSFWNAYGNKVGKKKMAENTWKKLSKADKLKALEAIKHYNNYLSRKHGIDKAHPTTYLNQEYYHNEWKSAV